MATLNLPPHILAWMERSAGELAHKQVITPAPRVVVRSLIHDIDTRTYALELRFSKIDGGEGSITIQRSLTASPQDVVRQLLDAGALLPSDRKASADLVQASLSRPPRLTRATTRRGGWHEGSFVTRGETFGPQAEHLSFVGSPISDPSIGMRRGTFKSWREGMREACEGSTFLTFGLGIGYAGPVLDLLGEDEGSIFNLYGRSSSGKTLIARCLHSQAGRAQGADIPTYGISLRGAEELCFARSDWAVVFDEEGRTTGSLEQRREKVRNIAFMVPSGRGNIRSERVGRGLDLPNLSWRVFGLSSGEKPLENPVTRRVAGEQLRHIDIKVPQLNQGGIFDLLDGSGETPGREGARLASGVEITIASNYGLARDRYLTRLTAERSAVEARVRQMVDDFVEDVGASTQPWERRLARKFGIVAAGAILAAEWEVAPFSSDHARRCVLSVYRVARRSIFSVEDQIGDVLRDLREARDQGRFPLLAKGEVFPERLRDTAWGFRRQMDGRELLAVLPEKFEELAPSRPSAVAVLDTLVERGVAITGPNGKRHPQLAVQGFPRAGRGRWVCLLSSKI